MELGHYGWNRKVEYYQTHPQFIQAGAPASPSYGLLNLGDGGFDGAAGHFIGSANGTYLAINAPSGFTGNLIDYQANGISQFKVDATGNVTATTIITTKLRGTEALDIANRFL